MSKPFISAGRYSRSCSISPARLFLVSIAAAVIALALAGTASASVWSDQDDMRNTTNAYDRGTFIYNGPAGSTMSRAFVYSPGLRSFYNSYGFDNNFLLWAPQMTYPEWPGRLWTACRGRGTGTGLCPVGGSVYIGASTVGHALADPLITTIWWNGEFISLVCGNWGVWSADDPHVYAPGPIPTIEGSKYEDVDADGHRDPGEPTLPGWQIRLLYNGNVVASTTTDANGDYRFELNANTLPIGPGSYSVEEVPQAGWVQSEAPDPVSFDYGASQVGIVLMDFGNYRPAKIRGVKWNDLDVDGVRDAGEPLLEGWTFDRDSGADLQTSAADGSFEFAGIKPGTHSVSEHAQPGWRSTNPQSGSISGLSLASGQILDVEFGNVCLGKIDAELEDADSLAAVSGVSIRVSEINVPGVLANDPSLPRTLTSPDDLDSLLPGTYEVEFTLPDDYSTTDPDAVVRDGRWVIVKTVTVSPCETSSVSTVVDRTSAGKVTGGVRFDVPNGFATAGFNFKSRPDGSAQGSLEHVDHSTGLNLHSNTIDAVFVSGNTAWVWGRVEIGDVVHRFRLVLVDEGEPGLQDDYRLTVDNGYEASNGSDQIRGNVQIHPTK